MSKLLALRSTNLARVGVIVDSDALGTPKRVKQLIEKGIMREISDDEIAELEAEAAQKAEDAKAAAALDAELDAGTDEKKATEAAPENKGGKKPKDASKK